MIPLELPIAGYLVAAALYLRELFGPARRLAGVATGVVLATLTVHLALLVFWGIQHGRLPVAGVVESLSLVCWALVLMYLLVELRWKLPALGSLVVSLGVLLMLVGLSRSAEPAELPVVLRSPWLAAHVTLAILGYAAFAVAFCIALLFLAQNALLKSKRLAGASRLLPSVGVADDAAYRMVTLGFPIFTLGLIFGAIWAQRVWPGDWLWDPKITASIVTWLIFAAYLHARLAQGWKGRRTAVLLVVGFLCVLGTYLGVGLLGLGRHSFV